MDAKFRQEWGPVFNRCLPLYQKLCDVLGNANNGEAGLVLSLALLQILEAVDINEAPKEVQKMLKGLTDRLEEYGAICACLVNGRS